MMLIKCPECGGIGQQTICNCSAPKLCPVNTPFSCSTCKGSGKVQVVVECGECGGTGCYSKSGDFICSSCQPDDTKCNFFDQCPHCHEGYRPLTEDEWREVWEEFYGDLPVKGQVLTESIQHDLVKLDGQPVKIMEAK